MDTPGGTYGSALTASPVSTYRLTLVIILAYALVALALVPFAGTAGPEIPGITAIFVAVVFVTELSTSFLLFVRFRETGAWSLLVLGCAYLFATLMVITYVPSISMVLLGK